MLNAPFAASNIRVKAASNFRPVLNTFVAPIFPEPMVLISPPPTILVNINPKGTLPQRYPTNTETNISPFIKLLILQLN